MALSGFHTDWSHGDYNSDRDFLIKRRENQPLMNGVQGSCQYVELVRGNPTIGYGYDLSQNSFSQIRQGILYALGINQHLSIAQLRHTGRADLADALEEIRDWKSGATDRRGRLLVSLDTLMTDLGNGGRLSQAIRMTDQAATILLDATLDGVAGQRNRERELTRIIGINLPQSRERVALMSMFYNGGTNVIGPGLIAALHLSDPLKSRAESWCQIRFIHDNTLITRRNEESDIFGFLPDGADALITAKCLSQVYNGKFAGGRNTTGLRIYDAICDRAGAGRVTAGLASPLQTVQNKYSDGAALAAVLVDDDGHGGAVEIRQSDNFGSGAILILAQDGDDEIRYYSGRNNYIDGGNGSDSISYKLANNIDIDASSLSGEKPHLIVKHDNVQDDLKNVETITTSDASETFHLRGLDPSQSGKIEFDTAGGSDVIWCADGRYSVNGGDGMDLYVIDDSATNTNIEFDFSGNFGRDVIDARGNDSASVEFSNTVKFTDLTRGDVNVIVFGGELYGNADLLSYSAIVVEAGDNSVATTYSVYNYDRGALVPYVNEYTFSDGTRMSLDQMISSADTKYIYHWGINNQVDWAEWERNDAAYEKYFAASHLGDTQSAALVQAMASFGSPVAMSNTSANISANNYTDEIQIAASNKIL